MNAAEAAELLAHAAAFDHRQPAESETRAWAEALADIPLSDALETVAAWYARTRDRLMPSDVRAAVRARRTDRINRAQLDPPAGVDPDDTETYRRWMLAALRATADGQPMPARPAALPAGGPATPDESRRGREALQAALDATAAARDIPAAPTPTGYERRRGPRPARTGEASRRLAQAQRAEHRPVTDGRTDADRARAGKPVTVCHGCAGDIPAPEGWDPANPDSPPVYCGRCRNRLDKLGVDPATLHRHTPRGAGLLAREAGGR